MAKFIKENFNMGSGSERWVEYMVDTKHPNTPRTKLSDWSHLDRRFVARFKYFNPGRSANHFVKFLMKNFTVEEYFEARKSGKTPAHILKEKGYICYNIQKKMKERGFPITPEGKKLYDEEMIKVWEKEEKAYREKQTA